MRRWRAGALVLVLACSQAGCIYLTPRSDRDLAACLDPGADADTPQCLRLAASGAPIAGFVAKPGAAMLLQDDPGPVRRSDDEAAREEAAREREAWRRDLKRAEKLAEQQRR